LTPALALINARLPGHPRADAVLVRDGLIQSVGQLGDAPEYERLDVRGLSVIPGFHDAHLHLRAFAASLNEISLEDARSIPELLARLQQAAVDRPEGTWVVGYGYDHERLAEGRHPTRAELDRALPRHAARLRHRSLLARVHNTAALAAFGLPATHPEVELLGTTSTPEIEGPADIGPVLRLLAQRGFTSVQDAGHTNDGSSWSHLRNALEAEKCSPRIIMLPGWEDWRSAADWPAHPALSVGPVKLRVEETALDADGLFARVRHVREAGRAVALHAVSEAEVAVALAALAASPPGPGPDRLEHGSAIPDELLDDLIASGATVVGQPTLRDSRGDLYLKAYEPDQVPWLHRVGSLVRRGIPYAASSDAPVTVPSAPAILSSLQRPRLPDGAAWPSTESLSPGQALLALTRWPAQAIGHPTLGLIAPGAPADLAIVDQSILDGTAPEDATAACTIVGGRIVWSRL
jgi:predicted amidohydrolase YtcJ